MRHWIRWAARLYPAAWRERYGDEFAALLDDVEPRWRDGFDVAMAAFRMHLTAWSYARVMAAIGLTGALAAAAVALLQPVSYRSSAMLQMRAGTLLEMDAMNQGALNRESLTKIIQQEGLYRGELERLPMEDVIETMRNNVSLMPGDPADSLRVDFQYPDAALAQRANRALVGRMVEVRSRTAHPAEVISMPSLPAWPFRPHLWWVISGGLGAGLLLGGIWAIIRRRPVGWTLRVAAAGLSGMVLGTAVSFLVPDRFVSWAVFRVSSDQSAFVQRGLCDACLGAVAEKLDLYHGRSDAWERTRRDMELKLQLSKPPTDVYTIQFTYADPGRAQNALREIMHELSDAALLQTLGGPSTSVGASPESSDSRELPAGVFEIVDPASLPEKPEMPNQLLGAAAGLMVGLASGAFWRRGGAAIPRSFQRARTGN